MKVALLHPQELLFPPADQAQQDGLLAVGGDLSVPRLLAAYRHGIFPWTEEPVTWWSPDPRAVFDLTAFHTPKRLVQKFRQGRFRITRDAAFAAVIAGCAEPAPGREETWITDGFVAAYTALHREGHAHSVEVWDGEALVGGIYGVAIGGFFAGESMFHRVTDASKLALCALAAHLQGAGFTLFDTQVATSVTRAFGAVDIARADYLRRLAEAVALPVAF